MPDFAIVTQGLGKQYRLNPSRAPYQTLRDTLALSARRALQTLRPRSAGAARESARGEMMWALRDLSLTVPQGEVVGIIGRNGAGKSTLLKVLARLTSLTEGEVLIRGRVGCLLEVGTGFHPELSGRENVYLSGVMLGMRQSAIRRRFDEIVSFAGVERFLDTPVKHYSSGMFMRLAFATAAHLDCEILLADETLAVGDIEFQRRCLGRLKAIAGEGRTVLFVSHNLTAVRHLCQSALVLEAGRGVFHGPVGEGVRHYIEMLGTSGGLTTDLTAAVRHGAGGLRLKRLQLLSERREDSVYTCGDPFEIRLYYEAEEDFIPTDLSIQVRFLNEVGDTLLTLWNKMVGPISGVYPRSGWLSFSLARLPLRPGVYPLMIWVKSARGLEDWLDRPTCVEVVEGDFFGTGRMPPEDTGPILVPYHFRVDHSSTPCAGSQGPLTCAADQEEDAEDAAPSPRLA